MSKKIVSAKQLIRKLEMKLEEVLPLNSAQEAFFTKYDSGKSQVLSGSAGTGKTFMAFYKAFDELLNSDVEYRRIVVVRSAVSTRDIGHLPGDIEEKQAIYEAPYKGICTELFDHAGSYDILKENGVIEFMLTSFVRGITLDKTLVIVDEFQNCTAHELDSIITRLGKDSKILFAGDTVQTDFTKNNEKDAEIFMRVLGRMRNYFDFNEFKAKDIVRSELVKAYIIAKEK